MSCSGCSEDAIASARRASPHNGRVTMRVLLTSISAILVVALLTSCAGEKDKLYDNPADRESDTYVGHEVRDPADPINVPSVEITSIPAGRLPYFFQVYPPLPPLALNTWR